MARVTLSANAEREFKKLPKTVRARLEEVILGTFARAPLSPVLDIKKLHTPFPGYRLRIGEYRVLFMIDDGIVRIYSIRHRKDAYR